MAQMLAWIRAIHDELKGAYGSPRMVRELRGRGGPASKERVEQLMREHGIRARHKRRYNVTMDSKHNLPVASKLLDRAVTPSSSNQTWALDISYLGRIKAGYILFNHEVVGCSLKPHMTEDIVTDALTIAWFQRKPAVGLMHHSDRGSQYASQPF